MSSAAQVVVVGNLGRDAEARYTPQGTYNLSFSIAVNEKRGGNDLTSWFNCTYWGDRAEKIADYLKKGKQVAVFGRLSLRQYQKSDGTPGFSADVNVNEITLLGSRDEASGNGGGNVPIPSAAANGFSFDDTDDVPF